MLDRLFRWVCSKRECNGEAVAHHRPRACPACGDARSLRFPSQLARMRGDKRRKTRYLQCRNCGWSYATQARLKRCWCGHDRFRAINHDEHYANLSKVWKKAVEEQRRQHDAGHEHQRGSNREVS